MVEGQKLLGGVRGQRGLKAGQVSPGNLEPSKVLKEEKLPVWLLGATGQGGRGLAGQKCPSF